MNRTYSFLALLVVVAISIVFGMVVGGRLNAPEIALAAPRGAIAAVDRAALPTAPAMTSGGRLDFADIAEAATPAVVSITNYQDPKSLAEIPGHSQDMFERFFEQFREGLPEMTPEEDEQDSPGPRTPRQPGQPQRPRTMPSFGSGFLISADGYLLSNHHVIENSTRLQVRMFDGESFDAELIGADPGIDLALLKIDPKGRSLPHLRLGDSDDLRVGEWVIAIGNPLEFDYTVTVGVVSAKNRHVPLDGEQFDLAIAAFIQTDAAINLGNSGGPLLNSRGEVVGINTAINRARMAEGIGFALQINEAKRARDQLLASGRVRRGIIGVTMNPDGIDDVAREYYKLPDRNGVLVAEVTRGGPADQAGIKPDDIIRRIDDRVIRNNEDLLSEVASRMPGEKVDVEVFREGKTIKTTAVLGERVVERGQARIGGGAEDDTVAREDAKNATGLGLTVETFNPAADPNLLGVRITDVEANSVATDKGLAPGMIITSINDQPVRNVADWRKALESLRPGSPVKLDVQDAAGQFHRKFFLSVPED